ncbi:MAG: hypothetical protein J4F49_02440 [Rhodobacteraceae bacterium]|nr:hypothetical protein [Paracoccaceae bacterium]
MGNLSLVTAGRIEPKSKFAAAMPDGPMGWQLLGSVAFATGIAGFWI